MAEIGKPNVLLLRQGRTCSGLNASRTRTQKLQLWTRTVWGSTRARCPSAHRLAWARGRWRVWDPALSRSCAYTTRRGRKEIDLGAIITQRSSLGLGRYTSRIWRGIRCIVVISPRLRRAMQTNIWWPWRWERLLRALLRRDYALRGQYKPELHLAAEHTLKCGRLAK